MLLRVYATLGLFLALSSAQTAPDAFVQVLKVVSEMNSNMKTMNSNIKTMSSNIGDLNLRVARIENRRMTSDLQALNWFRKLDQTTVRLETKLNTVETKQNHATDEIRFNLKLLHSEVTTTANGVARTNGMMERLDTNLDGLAAVSNQSLKQLGDILVCCNAASDNQTERMTQLITESNAIQNGVTVARAAVERLDTKLDDLAASSNTSLKLQDNALACCAAASANQTRLMTQLITESNRTQTQLTSGVSGMQTQQSQSAAAVLSELRQLHTGLAASALLKNNQTSLQLIGLSSQLSIMQTTTNTFQALVLGSIAKADCKQLHDLGYTAGVYTIYPTLQQPVLAYCSDGYTTLQRRTDGKESFDRSWSEYVSGFGDRSADHWIGLDSMKLLTAGRSCSLRIELLLDDASQHNKNNYKTNPRDADGKMKLVTVGRFSVGSAERYELLVEAVSTDLQKDTGALGLGSHHQKLPFSSKDKNQDPQAFLGNCAADLKGGWWNQYCSLIDLNGSGGTIQWKRSYCSAGNTVCAYVNPYVVRSTHMRLRC